jgi:hypothetical protein
MGDGYNVSFSTIRRGDKANMGRVMNCLSLKVGDAKSANFLLPQTTRTHTPVQESSFHAQAPAGDQKAQGMSRTQCRASKKCPFLGFEPVVVLDIICVC